MITRLSESSPASSAVSVSTWGCSSFASPDLDLATVQQELDDIVQICEGGPQAESMGQMSQSERFHWLVSPSSTVIQTSPVHTGLSSNPEAALEQLFKTMVYR